MIKRELVQFLIVALVLGLMGGCSKDIKDFENSTSYPIVKIEENITQNEEENSIEEMSSEGDTYLITSEAESEETESEVEMSEEEITEEETVEETFVEETTTVEVAEELTTKLETEVETTKESITTEAYVEQTTVHQREPETQKTVEPSTEQHTEPQTETVTKPEPQTEPQTQPQTEPQTQPQTEPQTQPQTEPQTQPQTEPQTEEVVDDHSNVDSYIDYSHGEPCLIYTERGVRKQADWIVEKFRSDVGYNPVWSKEYKTIKTFNWISNFMTYDIEVLRNPSKAFRNDYEWTGLGICDTYARAVITILNSCNVEAHYMVSWQKDHAYVKVIIDGKEYICNSLGSEFKYLSNPHLVIGFYDENYYNKFFEAEYGPFMEQNEKVFTDDELYNFTLKHGSELLKAYSSKTNVPADIYMDDHCGSAGSWFDLGYGVGERQLSFPGLYRK